MPTPTLNPPTETSEAPPVQDFKGNQVATKDPITEKPSPSPNSPPSREDLEAAILKMGPDAWLELAGTVWAQTHEAPTLVIWLRDSDIILRETAEEVFKALQGLTTPVPKLWVILNSLGGSLDGAYHIARHLQRTAQRVYVVIPRMAKSAATLITLGCHEVIMHPMAELGPIDTQIDIVRDDVVKTLSTLDALKSLEYLSEYAITNFVNVTTGLRGNNKRLTTRAASSIAASVTRGLVDPLFAQINPIQLGEVFRALDLSREYGKRLVQVSYPHLSSDQQTALVKTLAESYPAHGFVIDLKEAESLSLNVRATNPQERGIVDAGVNFGAGKARSVKLYVPAPEQPAQKAEGT
ncbi:hypothetical protein [Myxococcus sp. AS-1-15]|uniref:SDH family Clp fold serine proteinase n=1 Tax=Myxococcus sp. AS-1-15 TaxID=2874600 RepID=UPI001CBE7764|nr:hypothetical protein [Myxococcus sp. AS-1-15]MBZ4402472.1 hypothetical protein [Myxococcus sp. AS-1-15]